MIIKWIECKYRTKDGEEDFGYVNYKQTMLKIRTSKMLSDTLIKEEFTIVDLPHPNYKILHVYYC